MDSKCSCVVCKTEIPEGKSAKYFPFCSNKCQNKDLGNWVFENYRVAGNESISQENNTGDEE